MVDLSLTKRRAAEQQGTSCEIYATIIYYFTKALMRDRFFAPCYAGTKCKGDRNEYLDT